MNGLPWTAVENRRLKRLYSTSSNRDLLIFFPQRTITSILKRARRFGIYKTEETKSKTHSIAAKKVYGNGRPNMRGDRHPRWKGGKFISTSLRGKHYEMTLAREHPFARHGGRYVLTHRLVMERKIGRYLQPHEVVHHKNGDTLDNRLRNLQLFSSDAEHRKHHHKLGWGINELHKAARLRRQKNMRPRKKNLATA